MIQSASRLHINKLISFSTYKADMRIFICMERWGKLSRVARAGFDSSFLTAEATLWITWPWNIIRKKWVHDPDLNFWDRAFPHLAWAKSDSEMSQEDLDKNQEALPRLIPLEWTLGNNARSFPVLGSSWNQGTTNKDKEILYGFSLQ